MGTSTATNPLVDLQFTGAYAGKLYVWNCGRPDPAFRLFTVEVACRRWYTIYLPIVARGS